MSALPALRTALLLVAVAAGLAFGASQIPAPWGTCQRSGPQFDDCLKGALQRAITDLRAGNAQLGVQSLDPFNVQQFHLNKGGNGPLAIDMAFSNAQVQGISQSVVQNVRTASNGNGFQLSAELLAPLLNVQGDYTVQGRMLLIPINGAGQAAIRMDNSIATFRMTGHLVKDESQRDFLRIDSFDFDIVPQKAIFKFVDVNRSPRGDLLSQVVNDNDKTIWQELRPTIALAFSEKFKEVAETVFNNVAFDDAFPQ